MFSNKMKAVMLNIDLHSYDDGLNSHACGGKTGVEAWLSLSRGRGWAVCSPSDRWLGSWRLAGVMRWLIDRRCLDERVAGRIRSWWGMSSRREKRVNGRGKRKKMGVVCFGFLKSRIYTVLGFLEKILVLTFCVIFRFKTISGLENDFR